MRHLEPMTGEALFRDGDRVTLDGHKGTIKVARPAEAGTPIMVPHSGGFLGLKWGVLWDEAWTRPRQWADPTDLILLTDDVTPDEIDAATRELRRRMS